MMSRDISCFLMWPTAGAARQGDRYARSTWFKSRLAGGTALALLSLTAPGLAMAQTTPDQTTPKASTPTGAATPAARSPMPSKEIIVTGSRIKQDPNNSALPLQIITTKDFAREGISSPEQLISFLAVNGNGADNLASNSDVVSGAARGTNGLSAANLRGQGSASTLVLLNGRRVAAHGLQGSAVDVNQIPFAAIERVEVLKDGASAIYGTDAVGGVINFITKTNFTGHRSQRFHRHHGTGRQPDLPRVGHGRLGQARRAGLQRDGRGQQELEQRAVRPRPRFRQRQPAQSRPVDRYPRHADRHRVPDQSHRAGIGIMQNGTLLGDTTQCTTTVAGVCTVPNPNYLGNGPGFFIPGTTIRRQAASIRCACPGGAGCGRSTAE